MRYLVVKDGKLIETGFQDLLAMAYSKDLPEPQITQMRNLFFAGAKFLFSSLISMMSEGSEPTQKDMDKIELVQAELDEFIANFELQNTDAKGSA